MKTREVVLRLVLSALSVVAGLGLPASAHAQTRLEAVYNSVGTIYHRSSFDSGATWTPYRRVKWSFIQAGGGGGFGGGDDGGLGYQPIVVGTPALVSIRLGGLVMVARDLDGDLYWAQQYLDTEYWSYGSLHNDYPGGVEIGGDDYDWTPDSSPAVSSHATGRFDVYMVAKRRRDGALSLVHAYPTAFGALQWRWEVLGSGPLTGSPAAVSWGPGRIDVFLRHASGALLHKSFDGGAWTSGLEDLGGVIITSPAVTSGGIGNLTVLAVGTDRALWHRTFNWGWSGWENDGGGIIGLGTTPAVTSVGTGNVEAFVYAADRRTLYQRTSTWGVLWTVRQDSTWSYHVPMSAVYRFAP